MTRTHSYRFLAPAVLLMFLFITGCGKKNDTKPAAKAVKDSSVAMKDSTAVNDSTQAHDSSTKSSDSTTATKDSTHASDSTVVPVPELTYEQHQGKYVYDKYCSVCHGLEGKGDGFNAYNLDPKPRDLSEPNFLNAIPGERLLQTVRDGGRSVNKSPLMPAWGWTLPKEEIAYVIAYIRTFAPADTVNTPRRQVQ